ncbi:methyl-accepting chemotaxis protein [Chitiniphilus shinanonensis]|uniref:Methyl-accepting chemotaxis protein n=1 Tax=Chitiniphilus shinanonensis TaxID=553088 RepID=A0ABQ6BSE3_9NEIS|nr:HAMP domain-containing methyl-accepting chemotaxis protein [Chitiniphilus shinanonensis]GLS04362.1 methyl-accepting chemotaxis protein [Chitiniphilus shinanonensis]
MKIGMRVRLLGFAGLAVLLLALLLTWSFIEKAKVPVKNMGDNVIPTLALIGKINQEYSEVRRLLLLHVLNTDPQQMQANEQQITQLHDALQQSIAQYNKSLVDETDRRNSERLSQELAVYYGKARQVMELSRQLREEEATQTVRDATPDAVKVFDTLNTMSAYYAKITEQAQRDIDSGFSTLLSSLLGVCALAALVLVVVGELITRSVVTPLFRLRDFVANVARNYEFTQRLHDAGRDEVAQTSRAFDGLLDTLQGSLRELTEIGHKVGAHAGEVATASTELSTASQKVSESTTSMAAGVEQVTVSVNHVADRAENTDEIARSAGQFASDGGTVIGETIDRINHIAGRVQDSSTNIASLVERTASIGSVVNVIKEIADQTNLLALNAAIEAARAGEQGRGFAVVADEVRKLAERTASSTAEINDTVSAIQHEANQTVEAMQRAVAEVEEGVTHASQAGEAIQQIRRSTESVVNEVGQISSAMREQSSASTMMAQEIEKVAQMSEETSAAALRTSESSNDLHDLARDMQRVIERYKV